MTLAQGGERGPGKVSQAGSWEKWVGSCRGVEEGQLHRKAAHGT